jgi:hypothetical protein
LAPHQSPPLSDLDRPAPDKAAVTLIGLGNPKASDPILQPDLDYLELLANVDGVADDNQPRGRSYFAPSASELQGVFDQVARDLLVRLTQ